MENVIYGPQFSEETKFNMELGLSEYLLEVTKTHLDKVLMIDAETQEKITCGEIIDKSFSLAAFLRSLHCNRESVVAIVSENRFEYLPSLLATLHNGATFTCVNPLYAAAELLHAFKISKPSIVITTARTYEKVKKLQNVCNSIKSIINLDDMNEPYETDENSNYRPKTDSSETAVILYSSGTTGLSKGVMLMHKSINFLMEIYRTEKFLTFPEDNVISGILPMCHAYGLFSILSCFVLGHQYVLIKRYSETSFLQYIEKYKISTLYIVPTIALFLTKSPLVDDYDLSSVQYISSGGGPIRQSVEEILKTRLKCHVLQNYGMTETTTMVLLSLPTSKPGTTGRLLPGMMAKIVDVKTGVSLGPFQNGELCVKGPLIMKGYCDGGSNGINSFDADGWVHSGDIAYYDNERDFYVVDRLKELIKYKGFQVPPSELEILLLQLPAIEAVGVVGVPDEEAGELPRAYVVKKKGYQITEQDIERYVAENLSPQKKLRGGVRFVDELPKTISGKIERKELKKWVAAGL